MKKIFYSLMLASALMISFSACEKENAPEGEKPEDEKPVEKSKEAKLLTFDVTAGQYTIEGTVYENDKVVELVYMPEELEALKSATAVATYSEKATISPDPATAVDYTAEAGVKYTVTAEDGETKTEYTVLAVAAKVQLKCLPVWDAPKTFGALGIATYDINSNAANSHVAFSGLNFVTFDLQVFDLDGKKVGTVNTTGMPAFTAFPSMSNDEKGVLVMAVCVDKVTTYWAWKDGWDKAPAKLYETADGDISNYMSVSGDLSSNYLVTAISGSRTAEGSNHHTWAVTGGGDMSTGNWAWFALPYPSNDGNWSQMISAASADPNGYFFMMDSRGANQGVSIYSRLGLAEGNDTVLNGTIEDDGTVDKGNSANQYGNYSTGNVRAFTFNGTPYVVACSSGWPAAYFHIQPADPDEDYLLRGVKFESPAPHPCAAYMYDAATDTGHVILMAAGEAGLVHRYAITRTII